MNTLELTLMERDDKYHEALRNLLREFETQHKITVNVTFLNWETGWNTLVRVALYNTGPDISEVGSTWVSDFVGMNAIRPFSTPEVTQLGGAKTFFAAAWNSGVSNALRQTGVWSIPFTIDTRLFVYRRDWFAKAGVDEATAFATPTNLLNALKQLAAAGVPGPLGLPTQQSHLLLQHAASWVWGAQGRFFGENGQHTTFTQPAALAGMRDYFALGAFLAPPRRPQNATEVDTQFLRGEIAVALTGPWLLPTLNQQPAIYPHLGLAFPPGVPFVGGSHFVVWKHTPKESATLKLLKFLLQPQVQQRYSELNGLLPAQRNVFDEPPFNANAHYQLIREGLTRGRAHQTFALWGMVEERLMFTLAQLWEAILTAPETPVATLLAQHLEPLAQQLDKKLGR